MCFSVLLPCGSGERGKRVAPQETEIKLRNSLVRNRVQTKRVPHAEQRFEQLRELLGPVMTNDLILK